MQIIKDITTQREFYDFLGANHATMSELFIVVKRGDPRVASGVLPYLDAVEVALCFGWIDAAVKNIGGALVQRFCPRKGAAVTQLNIYRARRLEMLGMMSGFGRAVLPDLSAPYEPPEYLLDELKAEPAALEFFLSCPRIYQDIRLYNVDFYRRKNPAAHRAALENLIKNCKLKKMYGQWDDYGRLAVFCS